MAFTDYSSLQASVADWLARSDLSSGQVHDCITLFEAHANRRLRTREMEAEATLTPVSAEAPLPTDYLMWRRVTWNGSTTVQLEYAHPDWLAAAFPDGASGTPSYFTIEGSNLIVKPNDNTTLDLLYLQRLPALSNSNTSNWLLAAHPDAYLSGTLAAARAFLIDTPNAALWSSVLDGIFDEINLLAEKTKGGGPIKIIGTVV